MKRWFIPAGILVVLGIGMGLRSASAQTQAWPRSGGMAQLFSFAGAGRLGVSVRDVETADTSHNRLRSEHGAVVTDVEPDGAAAKAGIRKGDVIVEFDGESVRSASQFTRLVRETPVGRSVKIAVIRGDGQRSELTVAPAAPQTGINTDELRRQLENGLRSRRFYSLPDGRSWGLDIIPPEGDWQLAPRPFGQPPHPGEPGQRSPFPRSLDRGRMGVTIQELTPQLAEYFGTKDGLLVSTVVDDSPAAKAGLKAGDIITAMDGHALASAEDLRLRLERAPAGAEVTLDIVRNHKSEQLKVKLSDAGKARIIPL